MHAYLLICTFAQLRIHAGTCSQFPLIAGTKVCIYEKQFE